MHCFWDFLPDEIVLAFCDNKYAMMLKNKKLLWLIIGALAIVAVIYFIVNFFISKKPYIYAGTLETSKIIVSARVASDISDVFVIEGDVVQSGQPLMELSCDAYKIFGRQIDNDYDRAMKLMERGHVSAVEYDALTRNKQDNDLKLSWCVVKSPMNAMVTTKFREVGEVVAPGAPLIALANPYDIWAYFYVPYSILYKLSVGQQVIGVLPEADNMKFVGRIIKINEVAEFTPKNVQTRDERTRLVYGIKVQFENPDLILKAGMTIESTLMQNE